MNVTRPAMAVLAAVVLAVTAYVGLGHSDDRTAGGKAAAPAPSAVLPPAAARAPAAGGLPSSPDQPTATSTVSAWPAQAEKAKADFKESKVCYHTSAQVRALESIIRSCQTLPQNVPAEARSCEAQIPAHEEELRKLKSDLGNCADSTTQGGTFFERTRAAAAAGDPDAQVCYLQSNFLNGGQPLRYTQQDVNAFRSVAPTYIARGISRGDWRVVELLAENGPGGNNEMLQLAVRPDPYNAYVMSRLLELGADGQYAQTLENLIQANFLSPGITGAPPLSQQQVSAGSQQALQLYHRYFQGQARLHDAPPVCLGH